MPLLDADLDDFIDVWERAYGERLERGCARQRATELLDLFRLLAQRPANEERILEAPAAAEV